MKITNKSSHFLLKLKFLIIGRIPFRIYFRFRQAGGRLTQGY